MKHPFYKLLYISFLFFYGSAFTQNNVPGGWYIVNFNYNLSQKFTLYSEIQARSQHVADDFYYHELKAGASYTLIGNGAVFLGFGNYKTYTIPGNFKKPVEVNENRIWEQFTLTNNISRIKFEHRYRIEQRWLNGDFHNRFRYRLAAYVPINHATIKDNTLIFSVFDEVFFTDKRPYFLRNRVFLGPGYQINKLLTIQTGFLRQFDYNEVDGGTGKNFLQVSLLFTAGNSNRTEHRSNAD
ncbi:MAG TPA: DUF2490 domain-containing protein [Parafilimonas sp.]|nr:DUF2490 domain-containing protein [Parafilimonas sp.]